VTQLLQAWGRGDAGALAQLVPLVEPELRRIARKCVAGERVGNSVQATALVNEAYIRLVDTQRVRWQDRAHFIAMAARTMRRILVDHARTKGYQKRWGDGLRVTFVELMLPAVQPDKDVVALDDALAALEQTDARKSAVVELRFFGGLSVEETATVLGVSVETVMRDWKFAKTWLRRELQSTRP
jgi:RNA polymerase sigma factor (TIGR02999 family)